MRACLGCGKPVAKGNRCPKCKRENAQRRKAEGRTGERGSTYASRKRRQRVLERHNHRCYYCSFSPATREDHYVPLAKGGQDEERNMVAACESCNSAKSDRLPEDFLASNWLARRCEEAAAQRREGA